MVLADPTNTLDLNSGITSLFRLATAYAFQDCTLGLNGWIEGMGNFFQVLGTWRDAVYLLPKQEHVFQHGGTFVFRARMCMRILMRVRVLMLQLKKLYRLR